MSWIPGWDRDWLPYYMNDPIKNSNPRWNGCFAIPRILTLDEDRIIQQPIDAIKELRSEHFKINAKELPVSSAFTAIEVIDGFKGNQMEIIITFNLHNASFCGINVLSDNEGKGGLPIVWSGDLLNVDGVNVPIPDWKLGDSIELQIFVDKKIVEVFVDGGKYCISRQVREENVKGENITLTSLGGTAKMVSLEAWKLVSIN
jgi:beta-fructofuranosidase